MDNYYKILEVGESASDEVIKAAYRALVKKYHPDNYIGDVRERDKSLSVINEAYEVLSNTEKRKIYDAKLYNSSRVCEQQDKEEQSGVTNENIQYAESETDTSKEDRGKIRSFFKLIGKEIQNTSEKYIKEVDNAYMDDLNMKDEQLVLAFKRSQGRKRMGYIQALEERGLILKDEKGKFIPSHTMRKYW